MKDFKIGENLKSDPEAFFLVEDFNLTRFQSEADRGMAFQGGL